MRGEMANILVVEDEEQVLVLAVSIVEELGHTAQSASNMDEAWALLATDLVFDLLFIDLGLSGHDQAGLAFDVEAVRLRLPLRRTRHCKRRHIRAEAEDRRTDVIGRADR